MRIRHTIATVYLLCLISASALAAENAGPLRIPVDNYRQPRAIARQPARPAAGESQDALDEVNRERARRGLRPFTRDPNLTVAAKAAAAYRGQRCIEGHTSDDFAFLPQGSRCAAAGCAAWPQGSGWGACCTYEQWTYAGAAWAIGRDGRRYMDLYVR